MASSFKDLRIVDNFYQTSAFFPMPTLLISTLDEEGNTTMGAYSLCFHRQARLPRRNVQGEDGKMQVRTGARSSGGRASPCREKGWKLIDVPQLKEIQDKRSKEKNQRRR